MEEKELSPNTMYRHHAVLQKALDYAHKLQCVYRSVADAVSLPKRRKFTGKSYTKGQLKVLLNVVTGTKLEILIHLASYLGWIRKEITELHMVEELCELLAKEKARRQDKFR